MRSPRSKCIKKRKKGEAFFNWRLEPDYLTTFCLSLFPIRQFLWRLERSKPGSRVQVVQLGRTSEVISSKIHIVRDKKNQCSRKLKRRILCSLFQMCWKVLSKSKKKIFGISWRQREVLVSLHTVTWLLRTSTPRGGKQDNTARAHFSSSSTMVRVDHSPKAPNGRSEYGLQLGPRVRLYPSAGRGAFFWLAQRLHRCKVVLCTWEIVNVKCMAQSKLPI